MCIRDMATATLDHMLEEKHIKIEADFAIESVDNDRKVIVLSLIHISEPTRPC